MSKRSIDRGKGALWIDTLDGDCKRSRISISLEESQRGKDLDYLAEMDLGRLSLIAKGPATSEFEKAAGEDLRVLDSSWAQQLSL